MEFHEKDGGLYMPKKVGSKTVLVCRTCGHKKEANIKKKEFSLTTEIKKTGGPAAGIVVVEKKAQFEALPRTQTVCPNCGNREAYWWMQQTRGGDEPPTRFHRCTRCNHVWREYE
jgi:DNA-directed RNA polymerase subunit M